MFESAEIEVWNLTAGGAAKAGAVEIFNITGKLRRPDEVKELRYELNGAGVRSVYFNRTTGPEPRLTFPGSFNIDTVALGDLRPENLLRLQILKANGAEVIEEIPFSSDPFSPGEPRFALNLEGVVQPEEVGQVVEGPWLIRRDERGQPCLEITPENAGYDRIILFGHQGWTTGYEITARLAVTHADRSHNLGLIFKWNPHERGDGSWLPTKWSSGLAYYRSYGKPGLLIRFGDGVYVDETGTKHGSYELAHAPLNKWRGLTNRLLNKFGLPHSGTEYAIGRDTCFRMRVHPDSYALTVWPAGTSEPTPMLRAEKPLDRLPHGSVGILAYQIAFRLYELDVRPL